MSAAVRERPGRAGAPNGGFPARRAVVRCGWRLLRREWRQQFLILALITVAVAATFVGAAVATNTPTPPTAAFGTAQDLATFPGEGPHVAAQIASLEHRFGRAEVIENETVPVPGSTATYDLRAQDPNGPFGGPMLSLVGGHYPAGPGQVAVTSGVASDYRLKTGDVWRAGGVPRRVTGIVVNPQNTEDEFALVVPGQVKSPTQVTVLFDAPGVDPHSIGPNVSTPQSVWSQNEVNPETVSIAAATLGMLLIALVGVGGFTMLTQRRLRSIGILGAQGATDSHVRLVVRANGAATGIAGAVTGFALGLAAWLAYRPRVESSSHHVIGAFQLPWLVIVLAMVLAVLAAYFAAGRPARAVARVPIVAALSGRPAAPRQVHRLAVPAGVALLVVAFVLLGMAGGFGSPAGGTAGVTGPGARKGQLFELVAGFVAIAVAVVLIAPAWLAVIARVGRRAPVAVRLALRDLARYRARSCSALGGISLSVLIAVVVIVASAARFGNVLDYAGPNLAPTQLIVYAPSTGPAFGAGPGQGGTPGGHNPHGRLVKSRAPAPGGAAAGGRLAAATARRIAAALGSRDVITLASTSANLQHAAAGRNWSGPIYVATPQLLSAFGIKASQVSPGADILTMRPGLSTVTKMQLTYGTYAGGGPGATSWPCPAGACLASPAIEEVSSLPSGTSAPNTVITEHAVHELGLRASTAGWLIQLPNPATAGQIYGARQTAAAAGMTIETKNSIPSISQVTNAATVFGILLALGILAMSVGLTRSETSSDLRSLTATGASGSARRTLAAVTAGALALAGAVVGLACGYLAAIGFFRTNQLDGLASLRSIPVANLLLILIGMPLAAVVVGWLLGGREPSAIARQALE